MFSMNPDPASWLEVNSVGGEPIPLEFDQYPDGSFSFRLGRKLLDTSDSTLNVVLKSTLPQALMAAGQVINAINHQDTIGRRVKLVIQTLPDQRADRITRDNAGVPIEVTAAIISALDADEIIVHDVHSRDALESLRRECMVSVRHVDSLACFLQAGLTVQPNSYVVAVDEGATQRARLFADAFKAKVVQMDKSRDETGKVVGHEIINIELSAEPNADDNFVDPNAHVYVVDDLCDGGWTFISTASILSKAGFAASANGSLHLFVTHGLFSKGRDELLAHYDTVDALFSYDDWRLPHPSGMENRNRVAG